MRCPDGRRASNSGGRVRWHRMRPTGATYCGKWREHQLDPPGLEYQDGRECGGCERASPAAQAREARDSA